MDYKQMNEKNDNFNKGIGYVYSKEDEKPEFNVYDYIEKNKTPFFQQHLEKEREWLAEIQKQNLNKVSQVQKDLK